MRFADLAQGTLDNPELFAEINRLLEVKMHAGEAATSPRWKGIHAFILTELKAAQANPPPLGERRNSETLDELLRFSFLGSSGLSNEPTISDQNSYNSNV